MYMSLENTNIVPEIIYPDYKYCVWLIPEDKYWYNINRTITPHLSIKTNMGLADAINLHNALLQELGHKTIQVFVDKNSLITNDDNHVSLEYNLYYSNNNVKDKPVWWPNNAHMSLLYKYNDGVTENEKRYMNKRVNRTFARFGTPCIVCCKGHHREWKFVKI